MKNTVVTFRQAKEKGEKLTMLTAYDYSTAKLIDEVEVEIFNREEKEIPSSVIGEILMDKIKDLDSVAYVRFASVYREFKDVNTFMNELKKMLG